MKWSDLLENVKRKLKYMSAILNTKDIDVSGLDSGVYLVKVEDENASLATQKLVIK